MAYMIGHPLVFDLPSELDRFDEIESDVKATAEFLGVTILKTIRNDKALEFIFARGKEDRTKMMKVLSHKYAADDVPPLP